MRTHTTILATLCLSLALGAQAAPGDLDPTFGGGGLGLVGFGFGQDSGRGVARQADGKLVVAGESASDTDGSKQFTILRYNANGTLDTAFGTGGVKRVDMGGNEGAAFSVALQPDGKIVAAGTYFSAGTFQAAIARLNTDGTLDTTFNGTGFVIQPFSGVGDDRAFSVALQADGKIVAGGYSSTAGGTRLAVVRLNTNGTLDGTYGVGTGFVLHDALPFSSSSFQVPQTPRMLAVQDLAGSPHVLVIGNTDTPPYKGFILRLAPDGSKDPTFGTGGALSFDYFNDNSEFNALFVAPITQKIHVAGSEYNPLASHANMTLARLNSDGTFDPTFFGFAPGRAFQNVPGEHAKGLGLTVDPADGSVSVVGTVDTAPPYLAIVARFTSAGFNDTSFGAGYTIVTSGNGYGRDAVATGSGKVFVSGEVTPAGFNPDILAVQLLADASVDPAFGSSGYGTGDISNFGGDFSAIARQADGKLLAAGTISTGGAFVFGVARFLADGTLDTTFGGGRQIFDYGLGYNVVGGVLAAPGNKVVVTGFANHPGTGEDYIAVRYNEDGTLDTTFNGVGSVRVDITGAAFNDESRNATISPSGKVILGGSAGNSTGGEDVAIVRLDTNGALDFTFNGTGVKAFPIAGTLNRGVAIRALADESILVAGGADLLGAGDWFIAKLTPLGAFDPNFGVGGIVTGHQIVNNRETIRVILVQPDGKILGVGESSNEGSDARLLVRLLPNGALDPTFGTGGVATPSVATTTPINDAVLLPDGRIVTVGSVFGGGATGDDIAMTRYNANGSLDTTFGTGGRKLTDAGTQDDRANAALVLPDGKMIIAGSREGRFSTLFRVEMAAVVVPAPAVSPTATQIGFGNRELNTTTSVPVNVRNTGTAALVVSTITAEGPGFSQVNTCTAPVAIGASCPLTVRFTPTTTGVRSGLITIVSNAPGSPHSIIVSGNGLDLSNPLGDADGDGVPNGIEPTVNLDARNKDNDVFNSPRLFAMQQYRDFLGREGDAGGVNFWIGQLNTGTQTRGQMIENFFGSAEFQGIGAPVARLYFAYFLRIPDYPGLTFWINFYRAGNALSEVSQAFAGSQEFVDRYGTLTNSQFVDLVYQNVLGRPADAGGKAFWLGQLNGGMTRGAMMIGFSESAEFQASIFNDVYVTMMYVGMLKRSPDQGGFNFWTGYMDAGNSGLALINGFLAAPEYRTRFLP